jgi:hypothetical protein
MRWDVDLSISKQEYYDVYKKNYLISKVGRRKILKWWLFDVVRLRIKDENGVPKAVFVRIIS